MSALLIGSWMGMAWWALTGTGIMLAGAAGLEMRRAGNAKIWLAATCAGTVMSLGYLLFGEHAWENLYGIWSGLVSLSFLLTTTNPETASRTRWIRLLTVVWMSATDVICLAVTYEGDQRLGFYTALIGVVLILVLSKVWLRPPALVIQLVNTVILFVIGLPIANLCLSPKDSLGVRPAISEKPYTYSFYKKDPAAYARWWEYMGKEFGEPIQRLILYEADGPLRFRLRPNTHIKLVESDVSINSQGFRGPEIPAEKKDTYRIVALGESTTFGWTIAAGQKPWPESLEELIRNRLQLSRPVEVINAGTFTYDINQNIYRLRRHLLDLKPDMIISYHGFNGFSLVISSLPEIVTSERPPVYRRRPIKLLADLEYGFKLNRYKRHLRTKTIPAAANAVNPMDSGYATAYRELIQICRTNDIHLMLSTFSMSVNQKSDPDVIQFYNATTMELPRVLQANVLHTLIVKNLAAANPDIGLIDTQARLDGDNDSFLDTIHFSPEGERKMAETVFDGIKDYLKQELAKPAESQ